MHRIWEAKYIVEIHSLAFWGLGKACRIRLTYQTLAFPDSWLSSRIRTWVIIGSHKWRIYYRAKSTLTRAGLHSRCSLSTAPMSTTSSNSMEDLHSTIEVDLDVGHLLAQLNNNAPPLESPDLEDLSNENIPTIHSNARPDRSTHRPPRQKHKLNAATTMEERLVQMKEVRSLPWRDGVEPGADNETGGESRRKQIRFGCLLATRGEIQEVPCNSCANGRGKFRHCIALEGFFKGACASCQLSGRPNRCSIKKNDGRPSLLGPQTKPAANGSVQMQSTVQQLIHLAKRQPGIRVNINLPLTLNQSEEEQTQYQIGRAPDPSGSKSWASPMRGSR